MELSKTVSAQEIEVEELFESLEVVQTELDEAMLLYEEKIEALI